MLVLCFTDTAEHNYSPVEQALCESQAREQQVRAESERAIGKIPFTGVTFVYHLLAHHSCLFLLPGFTSIIP